MYKILTELQLLGTTAVLIFVAKETRFSKGNAFLVVAAPASQSLAAAG
jgi:hypothetical protein